MLAGEKLVKAQHEDELSRTKQHQELQMERLRELQRQVSGPGRGCSEDIRLGGGLDGTELLSQRCFEG